jgi:8-oxo-dGTP pyrophosphatase MutT (NUDIX family)
MKSDKKTALFGTLNLKVGPVMDKTKSAVACVIYNELRSQVCLIKRRDVPIWVLPGGGIDPGETPDQAAERETYEELGAQAVVKRLVGIYLPKNRLCKKTFLYELCLKQELIDKEGEEILGAKFFDLNALPPMPPPYQAWIDEGLKVPGGCTQIGFVPGVTWLNFVKFLLTHPVKVLRFILSRWGLHWNS